MKPISTVIAEDEAPARQWMRALCAKQPDLQIVGECATVGEAAQRLRSTPTDLLLLDIRLGPHLGFRALESVPPTAVPLVVVTTAYDEYAVRAFERNAVDYLMKPVREDRFTQAVQRVRRRLHAGLTSEMRAQVQAAIEPLYALFARREGAGARLIAEKDSMLHVLDAHTVELLEANGNYVELQVGAERYAARATLNAMEEMLPPRDFLRVSRSALVNLALVSRIERDGSGGYAFITAGGRRVNVGRSYRKDVTEIIRSQGLLQR